MTSIVRSGPLTLAQQRTWLRSYWRGQGELFATWSKWWEMPPGLSTDGVIRALTVLAERHEILRTVFVMGPDGLPVQIVFGHETFRPPVSLSRVSELDAFRRAQEEGPMIAGVDRVGPLWAVRLFTEGPEVRCLNLVFDHIVSDGTGLANWQQQLLDLAHGGDTPAPLTQPLDRALAELRQSGRPPSPGRRGPDVAVRTPQIPAPLPSAGEPGPERFLLSSTTYEDLLPVVDRICAGGPATRPMVFLFAVAWLLSRYHGQRTMLFANYVSNRTQQDHGIECQMRPMEIPLAIEDDASFEDALHGLCTGMLRAYEEDLRHGPVAPEERAQTLAERGVGFVMPPCFNYQGVSRGAGAAGPAGSTGRIAARSDTWEVNGRPWLFMVYVYVRGDTVVLDLDVDAAMLPRRVAHSFADVLPDLLQFMADRPTARVGDADVLLPPDLGMVTDSWWTGGNWVAPDTLRRVLEGAPGVRAARVCVEAGELLARVALTPGTPLTDVHDHVCGMLHDHLDVAAPQRYVPEDDASGWWPPEVPAEGWRPPPKPSPMAPVTRAEQELCEAIRETHGHEVDSVAQTYVAAGGRVILGPAVVEALARRGLVGLRSHHLNSACTLRGAARGLAPRNGPHLDGASYLD
ncbi:condensation domain-containing protein [Streptomyces sp. NPDC051217]|uniref:condensation domain-containing protein n=1 Tax=Streptomyces sp. NPDC051217 TaxID=3365644 RepID=UPI0037ACDF6B